MTCEQIEPWISAYQDGELNAPRRRVVEAHLAACPACQAVIAEWQALEEALRADLARCEAPETLHARVMREIPAPKPAPAPIGRAGLWRPGGWFSFGLVPLGAATAWLLLAPHLKPFTALLPSVPVVMGEAPIGPGPLAAESGQGSGAAKRALQSGAAAGTTKPHVAIVRIPAPKEGGAERPKVAPHPNAAPGSRPGAHPPESGGSPSELERLRRLRQQGRRRWHHPLAEYPGRSAPRRADRLVRFEPGRWRPRRSPRWPMFARQPETALPIPPAQTAAARPRITVVDYVLPEVKPQSSGVEAGTEFVLRAAEPVRLSETVFDF